MASCYNKLFGFHDDSTDLNDEYDVSGSEDEETDQPKANGEEAKPHAKLMESMSSLDTKRKPKLKQRSEASGEVSEFNFSGRVGESRDVKMHELMGSLANTPSHSELKKQLSNVQRNEKVLHTPLHKHAAEKVRRTVAYEAASKEVTKWDQVVQTNRKKEHQSFPLNQPVIGIQTTDQFIKQFKPSTPLEQEVYKMLHGSKHNERRNKELTVAEEEALQSMSLEEAQERRAELQKTRALLSYYEAKCHRKKKIKSKMYHRIQRKSKNKEGAEKLKDKIKASPEDAEEILLNLEKARAKERVTLKHRNTGKWAKGIMRFGKYDQSARSLLADQLQKSHELTKKIAQVNEDEDDTQAAKPDGEDSYSTAKLSLSDINNPWFAGNTASKKQEVVVQSKVIALQPVSSQVCQESSDSEDDTTTDDIIDKLFEEDKHNKHLSKEKGHADQLQEDNLPLDEALIHEVSTHDEVNVFNVNTDSAGIAPHSSVPTNKNHKNTVTVRQEKETSIDLSKVLTNKAIDIQSAAPELVVSEDQEENKRRAHLLNIQEAFAEDDVVRVFEEEKQERIDRDKPKDIDLSLPGWGSWGGAGVQPSKKKSNRFLIKGKPAQPRRDENLQHVLINESRDKKIAVHQVNQLPFPFGTTEQFQRSIRAPIGSTWNTPSTVKKLTIPKVTTKLGSIIEPITAVEAFTKSRKRKAGKTPSEKQHKVTVDLSFNTEKQHTKRKTRDNRKK